MRPSVSVIILAGGQSSRMGRDKALITVEGIPLLQRTCEIALQCASQVFVVTSSTRNYSKVVPDRCYVIQERLLPGESKPQGPLIGFTQGLIQIETEWVLLLACDLPRLNKTILQRWGEQLIGIDGAIALLPQGEKGWEPLCGFYQTACLASLTQFIDQGGRSLQAWLAEVPVEAIQFSTELDKNCQERAMLFNCNTPEDLWKVTNNSDMP
jgi:molybdopterin-guanine dinucleotide biosynthesis protein A